MGVRFVDKLEGEPLTSDPSANYDEIKFLIEEVKMFQEKHLDHEIRVS